MYCLNPHNSLLCAPSPTDTAYCLNPHKRKFFCFDDNEVKDVQQVKVRMYVTYEGQG